LTVENERNINASEESVQHSRDFVAAWSVAELNISSSFGNFQGVSVRENSGLKFTSGQRTDQNMRNFNDNFKSNEVNDAVLDVVLVSQKINIDELS
jgi:hypothetical protein